MTTARAEKGRTNHCKASLTVSALNSHLKRLNRWRGQAVRSIVTSTNLHRHCDEGVAELSSIEVTSKSFQHFMELFLHIISCFFLEVLNLGLGMPVSAGAACRHCGQNTSSSRNKFFQSVELTLNTTRHSSDGHCRSMKPFSSAEI